MSAQLPDRIADLLLRIARAQVPGNLTGLLFQISSLHVHHEYTSLGEKQKQIIESALETAASRIAQHLRAGTISLAERDLLFSFLPSTTRDASVLVKAPCFAFSEGEEQYGRFRTATNSLLKMAPDNVSDGVDDEVFCHISRTLAASAVSLLFDLTRQEAALKTMSCGSVFKLLPGYREFCEIYPLSARRHAGNACCLLHALLWSAADMYKKEDQPAIAAKILSAATMVRKETVAQLREARRTVEIRAEEPAHTTKLILQVITGLLRSELEVDNALALRAAFAVPVFRLDVTRLHHAPLDADTKLFSLHSAAAVVAAGFEAVGRAVAPEACLAMVLGSLVCCKEKGFLWLDKDADLVYNRLLVDMPVCASRAPLTHRHRSGLIAKKPRTLRGLEGRKAAFTPRHAALGSLLLATDEAVGRGSSGAKNRELQLLAAAAFPRPPVLAVAGDEAAGRLFAKARAATLVAPDLVNFTRAAAVQIMEQEDKEGRLSPSTALRRVTKSMQEGVTSAAKEVRPAIEGAPPRALAVVNGLVHRAGALAEAFVNDEPSTWTMLAESL